MRTIEYGTTTHVPAFLTKLWKLVTDESCDELICWSVGGSSFIIYDEIRFSKELLPMYFKHNNMASFVRQLNMYGFRKLSCIDQGGMHCYKNEIEFYHQYFIKGQESLLELIKRKIPSSKSEEPKVKQEYIDELITNIKSLRGKQESTEQNMRNLRRENRILWRHVNCLTDSYSKQQAVLQQLVPFFMNMVRSSREIGAKRKPPLMIDEGDMHAKMARLSPPYYLEKEEQDRSQAMPSPPGNISNRGPVIHDVTEMESSKMFPANILCSPNSSASKDCEAIVDSPLSCNLESSEQTIDSPYNEPGSMETFNILNHNFERFEVCRKHECRSRSSSVSSHMELNHSPMSSPSTSTSQSFHLQTQACDIPTLRSPVASYSPQQTGIPPVSVIDEATSDVPLESLIQSSFVPKIENTCSDDGMYTITSILRGQNNSVLINGSKPIVNENSSSIMAHSPMREGPVIVGGRSPIANENAPMINQPTLPSTIVSSSVREDSTRVGESTSSVNDCSQVLNERNPMLERQQIISETTLLDQLPTITEKSSSTAEKLHILKESSSSMETSVLVDRSALMNDKSSPVIDRLSIMNENTLMMDRSALSNKEPSSVMNSTPMMSDNLRMMHKSPLINGKTSSVLNGPSVMNPMASSMSGGAAAGRGTKFIPGHFINGKNTVPDLNWLYNQDAYANDANIENWLGQIFKSDNLVAGCSLPQE